MRIGHRSAFTFIELLIVVTIFSLLSLALYATFASGMRVWGRVQDTTFLQKRALLRTEKLAQELRQLLKFPKIGFLGEEDLVSFPILSGQEKIVKVTYYFKDHVLFRQQEQYKEPRLGDDDEEEAEQEPEPKPRELLSGVTELKFSFAYQGTSLDGYTWKDDWETVEGLPIAVKVELKTKDANFAKSVIIPVS